MTHKDALMGNTQINFLEVSRQIFTERISSMYFMPIQQAVKSSVFILFNTLKSMGIK